MRWGVGAGPCNSPTYIFETHTSCRYDTHHDFFDYRLYKNDPGTMHLIQNGHRNRMITVLWCVGRGWDGPRQVVELS